MEPIWRKDTACLLYNMRLSVKIVLYWTHRWSHDLSLSSVIPVAPMVVRVTAGAPSILVAVFGDVISQSTYGALFTLLPSRSVRKRGNLGMFVPTSVSGPVPCYW